MFACMHVSTRTHVQFSWNVHVCMCVFTRYRSVYQVLKDEDVVDSHYDKDGKQIGCDSQLLSVHYDVEKENVQINIRAHMQNGSVVKADDSVLEDDGPGILNESCNSSLISKSREKEENEDDEGLFTLQHLEQLCFCLLNYTF